MTNMYNYFKPAISFVGNNKKKVILGLEIVADCIIYRYRKQIGERLAEWFAPLVVYTPHRLTQEDIQQEREEILKGQQELEDFWKNLDRKQEKEPN